MEKRELSNDNNKPTISFEYYPIDLDTLLCALNLELDNIKNENK